jgi:hypothetical protein
VVPCNSVSHTGRTVGAVSTLQEKDRLGHPSGEAGGGPALIPPRRMEIPQLCLVSMPIIRSVLSTALVTCWRDTGLEVTALLTIFGKRGMQARQRAPGERPFEQSSDGSIQSRLV